MRKRMFALMMMLSVCNVTAYLQDGLIKKLLDNDKSPIAVAVLKVEDRIEKIQSKAYVEYLDRWMLIHRIAKLEQLLSESEENGVSISEEMEEAIDAVIEEARELLNSAPPIGV